MLALAARSWVSDATEQHVQEIARSIDTLSIDAIEAEIDRLATASRRIHERDCINLNPAANAMNPRAEAMLAQGLSSRPSLGYPGAKYETGLEAIERIEVIAAELAARVFGAPYVEIRVPSGSLANLYAFMATCEPGDCIVVPPASIAGHVTHHLAGAAGLYGLEVVEAPVDAASYTVELSGLHDLVRRLSPRLITVGGSLSLFPHPVRELRGMADEVGAFLLYDAAHMSGLIAGRAWQQPLAEGAHLMTMSTYKSLGGPASGLVLTTSAQLAERLDAIAHPGLTANFDVGKSAALAIGLLDWLAHGEAYADTMVQTAKALAVELDRAGLPVFAKAKGFTTSHQLALEARSWGGGQAAAHRLREANILASGIGLPIAPVADDANGLRLGSNEIVRWGMGPEHMPELARLIARALSGAEPLEAVGRDVTAFRRPFDTLRFVRT